jgi:hypothetical protein
MESKHVLLLSRDAAPIADRLEDDWGYLMGVLDESAVNRLDSREVTDFDDAIECVQTNQSPALVDVLRAYEKARGDCTTGFQSQRRVNDVETVVWGLFDGERFVDPTNYSRETRTETQTVAV